MERDRASMILLLMGETERGDVSAGKKLFAAVYAERTVLPSASLSGVVGVQRNDGHFERRAAVKFLRLSLLGRGGAERFKREGAILARLAHPHVVQLLDAGVVAAGQPCFILEYVEGLDIISLLQQAATLLPGVFHIRRRRQIVWELD